MADTAQHLLGQLVDGRFPLRKLLGVSSSSAVFLTELASDRPGETAPEGALKLIPEDPESSDRQLARWKAAAALSSPGLLPILHFGRCTVDDRPCLYVVTELASENLGELLHHRALTPEEAVGLLTPVLGTLAFLHENGLVHGGVKPSNILAIGDRIQLSRDRMVPTGESAASSWPLASPYLAPEPVLSASSDVWSLGVSLYEALTQYLPNRDSSGRYVLPQLASPFSEIVRGALLDDPAERMTLDDIRAQLDPAFAAERKLAPAVRNEPAEASAAPVEPEARAPEEPAAAAHAANPARAARPESAPPERIDPLSVPLSPVAPKPAPARIPVSSLPNVNVTIAAPRRAPSPRATRGSFKYFLVGAAGTLLVAALVVPRLLHNDSNPSAAAPANRPETPATTNPPATTAPPASAAPVESPAPAEEKAAPRASAAPARTAAAPPPLRSSASDPGTPEVSHRVIPEVSEKARSTIRGTVRIKVRVEINPDGTVSSADLDSPATSQFFAGLALKAARQWQFAPGASSALLRFDFTNSATTAAIVR